MFLVENLSLGSRSTALFFLNYYLNLKKIPILGKLVFQCPVQVARTDSIVIRTDKEVLERMGDWCTEHHGKSGLTKACLESQVR